jgi:hypothetical protein
VLDLPFKEAVKVSPVKLRLKKEVFLRGDDDNHFKYVKDLQSPNLVRCNITIPNKFLNKTLSCENPDGSSRELELSSKTTKVDYFTLIDGPFDDGLEDYSETIQLKTTIPGFTDLTCFYNQDIPKNAPSTERVTLREVITALSTYFELEQNPVSPTI